MNKKVLVTGGNGGIALELKKLLVDEGFQVFAPTKEEMDVTNLESVQNVIENFVPDILVNNAGCVIPQDMRKADYGITKKHIDINLLGTFWCAQVALANNRNTDIINIGSAAAVETHATWSEYCATKAAVVMATKCWAEAGIYSVCISPGRTRTKMRKGLYPDEDQSTLLAPEDFAKIVVKAVHREYESGTHIVVRKQNVEKILRGEIQSELC